MEKRPDGGSGVSIMHDCTNSEEEPNNVPYDHLDASLEQSVKSKQPACVSTLLAVQPRQETKRNGEESE